MNRDVNRGYSPSGDEQKIQAEFIRKIHEINQKEFSVTGIKKKMAISTYGCQMNSRDSEKIQGMLGEMGYEICGDETQADLILYNTCCIRENAENRMYGNLGFIKTLKRDNKKLKVILCGCMMQQRSVIEKIRKSYNVVDVIFGTYNLYKLPELLYANMESGDNIIDIWQEQKEIIEDLPSVRKYSFKAGVNIMYGCNNFCTYCIVPYVRGRERSRTPESIVSEIESLVDDGVVEIMLLGQNVNSYGRGLEEEISFAELLRRISKIKGLKRIRFMTSHPKDLSDELIEVIRSSENVCKSVHLPIQSGSTRLLEKMNRKYTKESYLELVRKLRNAVADIAITTDIITGFPSETDFDNDETIEVIKSVGYSSAFTFIYSKREGTPAAVMDEQVEETDAKRRFNKILDVLNPIIYEKSHAHVGKVYEALAEEVNPNNPGIISGRLDDNSIVHFNGSDDLIGKFVNVKITDCKTFFLMGEMV